MCGIIIFTMSPRSPRRDAKADALRAHGTLHPRPEAVQDPLFASHDFFDRRDLVQVKYEMLRQVDVEGTAVARTADAFGVSRPTFYQTQAAFKQRGIAGLVPRKRGPHGAHKLDDAVMTFVATRGKKTPLSERPDVASEEPAIATLVASYEALRRTALGQRGPHDGPNLG